MILTIGQYIEALANSDGRLRTLGKVWPVRDADGNPVFAMPGHGLVDFEVMSGDERLTLRCPLRSDSETGRRMRALRDKDKGLGSRFFREWSLLEKEIVLFDNTGNYTEADILVRRIPKGQTAADFLQRMVLGEYPKTGPVEDEETGGGEKILAALKSFGELALWARSNEVGITARKLLVTDGGGVFATGFSADDSSAMIALAFLFAAAMPGMFAEAALPLIAGRAAAHPIAERLCAASQEAGFAEPSQILAGDVGGGVRRLSERGAKEIFALGGKLSAALGAPAENMKDATDGYSWREDGSEGIKCVRDGAGWKYVDRNSRHLSDTVWLHAAPFREGRAEVETAAGKGLIDRDGRAVLEPVYEELAWDEYFGLVAAMKEGRWSLLDREGILLTEDVYDWLGECSEGLILAQKDGKCGFIDAGGREAIPFVYDDATSFSEGCAFVTADGESYFIDSKGNKLPA